MSIPLSLAYIKSYLFVISIARKVMPRYSCSRSCFTMLLTPFPLLDGVFLDRSLFFLLPLQFERARKGVIISFYFLNLSSFQEKKKYSSSYYCPVIRPACRGQHEEKKRLSFYFTVFPYLFAAWVRTPKQQPRSGTCALWQEKRLVPAFYFYC